MGGVVRPKIWSFLVIISHNLALFFVAVQPSKRCKHRRNSQEIPTLTNLSAGIAKGQFKQKMQILSVFTTIRTIMSSVNVFAQKSAKKMGLF
jgi:hypothetical protein